MSAKFASLPSSFTDTKANANETIVIIAKQCSRYIMTMESDCLIHNRKSCFHFVIHRVAHVCTYITELTVCVCVFLCWMAPCWWMQKWQLIKWQIKIMTITSLSHSQYCMGENKREIRRKRERGTKGKKRTKGNGTNRRKCIRLLLCMFLVMICS